MHLTCLLCWPHRTRAKVDIERIINNLKGWGTCSCSSKRTNLHAQENFYRPILEYRSASILLICSVSMLYIELFRRTGHRPNSSVHLNIAFFAVPLSLQNSSAILDSHWRVFKRHFMFVSLDSLRVINKSNFFSDEQESGRTGSGF